MALRGIEPRSPEFHSGAFLSILPKHHLFVMSIDRSLFSLHRIIFINKHLFLFNQLPWLRLNFVATHNLHWAKSKCSFCCSLFIFFNHSVTNFFADEERFELSTLPLTTGRSAVELFIQLIGRWDSNSYLHPGTLPIKRQPISLHRWPGETRTHNSRRKRPVLWSNWVTNHFVMTDRFELSTFTVSA